MRGIYILTNRINQKQYIGQSIELKKRIANHLAGYSGSTYIAKAIKKHGKENFDVQIIEYPHISPQALDAIEQWYIAKLKTLVPNGYNLTIGGETHTKYSAEASKNISKGNKGRKQGPHSPEHREKIAQSLRGKKHSKERIEKMSKNRKGKMTGKDNPNYGKPMSKEQRKKISNALKGEKAPNYGKKLSKETREKLSKALKGKPKSAEHKRKLSEAKRKNQTKPHPPIPGQ